MKNRLVIIIVALCAAIIAYLYIMKQQGQMQATAPGASPANGLVSTDMGAAPIAPPVAATAPVAPATGVETDGVPAGAPAPASPLEQTGDAIRDAATSVNNTMQDATGINATPPSMPQAGPATPTMQEGQQPPAVPSTNP